MIASRWRKQHSKKPATVVLTPLLDMFTIILIFLIVSFDTEDYEFELQDTLKPPISSAQSVFKAGVDVAVTTDGVFIEGDKLLPLDKGLAPEELYVARLAAPLVARFDAIYKARFADDDEPLPDPEAGVDPSTEDAEFEEIEEDDAILIIQADKALDYRTIHLVMNSAREAGFFKYRLAVIRK